MRAIRIDQSITARDEHSFQLYLNELDQMELISAQEEIELARRIRMGDRVALSRLVRANLRFVVSCAKKYQRLGLPLSDLVSEGNLGLIKAAELFDETKGFKFISYAVWWIRQSMMQALSSHARMIRLPANMVRATSDIRRMADLLEQRLERVPTEKELRDSLYVAGDGFAMEYAFGRTVVSLDEPVKLEGGDELWSLTADANSPQSDALVMEQSTGTEVAGLLAGLGERERRILTEFFGLSGGVERTLEDISLDLGVSRERVRQLKNDALEKLKSRAGERSYRYG